MCGPNPVLPKGKGLALQVSPGGGELATQIYALASGPSYSLPVLALQISGGFGSLQPADHV